MLRKLMICFWLLLISSFIVPFPASADSNTLSASPAAIPATVNPASPLYTDLLLHNMFHSLSCIAIGQSLIGQPCLTYQISMDGSGAIKSIPVLTEINSQGGALGASAAMIGALYSHPPVRTADYLASLSGNFGLIRQAKADVTGSGEQILNPIIGLWQVSRNIAYVLLTIILFIIGLMVLFRNKINPQTVISAQAAIPGLLIGLVMIYFSYFFAGLISDMAFIGTNFVGYYFSAVKGQTDNPQNLAREVGSYNALRLFAPFTKAVDRASIERALSSVWNDLTVPGTAMWDADPQSTLIRLSQIIMTQFTLPIGSLLGGWGQAAAGIISFGAVQVRPIEIVSIAISFVAMVILIYTMFRLLLRLANSFITIIFLTITAPFQFLAAALPGRQGIATNWILNMLSSVLAFPAVLAVLYFVAFILGPSFQQNCPLPDCPLKITGTNGGENNSIIKNAYADVTTGPLRITDSYAFPLLGGFDIGFINLLLAFAALTALPSVPDIIARSIGKMGAAGQLIGQEISSSYGAGQRYAGQFQQGVGGFAQNVGRLPSAESTQYLYDPNFGGAGKPGFRPTLVKTEGQIERAQRGITNLGNAIRTKIGRGTKI